MAGGEVAGGGRGAALMGEVDWIPGIITAVAGIVGGTFVAWKVFRSGGAPLPEAAVAVLRDYETRSEALFRQLRELDEAADTRTPEQLARERYALELEAARALRDLERTTGAAPVSGEAPPRREPVRPASSGTPVIEAPVAVAAGGGRALRGFLWGAGTMAGLGLMLFFVSRSAAPRREGGQLTGNLPGEEQRTAASGEADPELAELQGAVAGAPDDIEARLALARAHLSRQDMMAVWNETKAILERSPGEPRALAYQALVRLAMGQGDLAEQMLKKAIADRPDFVEGHVHLALVYARTGQVAAAEKTIDGAAKRFPQQAPMLKKLWEDIRASAVQEGGAEVRDPHSDLAPPAGVAADSGHPPVEAPPSAAADGTSLRGTIDLAPSLKGKLSQGVLFIMLREAGESAGPPIAAKRLMVSSFPYTFQIGAADAMLSARSSLPESLRLEARLDSDGDPTTRDPADPKARLEPVKPGAGGLKLVLESAR